jgi:hypothetical protein
MARNRWRPMTGAKGVMAGAGVIIMLMVMTAGPAVGARGFRVTSLDIAGRPGGYPSITTGLDGFGLISHYEAANRDLKVAHCRDAQCSAAEHAVLDSAGKRYDLKLWIGHLFEGAAYPPR